jgi:hypothetical protein
MVAGPLKRPDEIGFREGFDLIEFLLVFRSQLFVRDRFPFDIPTAEVDVVSPGVPECVVGQNPLTGVDRQHETQEARSLYLSALQLASASFRYKQTHINISLSRGQLFG